MDPRETYSDEDVYIIRSDIWSVGSQTDECATTSWYHFRMQKKLFFYQQHKILNYPFLDLLFLGNLWLFVILPQLRVNVNFYKKKILILFLSPSCKGLFSQLCFKGSLKASLDKTSTNFQLMQMKKYFSQTALVFGIWCKSLFFPIPQHTRKYLMTYYHIMAYGQSQRYEIFFAVWFCL